MFTYSHDNKRYHTFNYFLKNKFGFKVAKIPLDIHSTCPNKINGGCIYCSNNSISNITDTNLDIIEQYKKEINIYQKKWPNCKYIAYLQSGTNTNIEINELEKICDLLLSFKDCVGIAIATRPDCISDKCLDYLIKLNNKTFLSIELGLQSSNNNTLKYINRGHTKEDFENCVKRLQNNNIFTVAHIINGLPNETKEDMLNTVKFINNLNIQGIKIHMLYIAKNTPLEKIYNKQEFHILTMEEYIDVVCDQLRLLNEKIVIERITGDPIKEELIAPTWLLKKFVVLNNIDKEMNNRNIYQGDML